MSDACGCGHDEPAGEAGAEGHEGGGDAGAGRKGLVLS